MKDRLRPSSLRVQLLARTLIAALLPIVVLGVLTGLAFRELHSSANGGIAVEELATSIDRMARLLSLAVVLVLLLGVFGAAVIATSLSHRIVDPIERLSRATSALTTGGLLAAAEAPRRPDRHLTVNRPGLDSDDEMADLADSIGALRDQALRLVGDQAMIRQRAVGALGRRCQVLVARQSQLIGELGANEHDADRLAALFQLDQLAGRLNRSVAGALVLSGSGPASPHTGAVPIELLVTGVLADLEADELIHVSHVEHAALAGTVVADTAHIIAELIDHRLVASASRPRIEVFGKAGALHYAIGIDDRNGEASEAEMTSTNEVLRRGLSASTDDSGAFGFAVVAELAARHGIGVSLSSLTPSGVGLRVSIPNELIESTDLSSGGPAAGSGLHEDTIRPGPSLVGGEPAAGGAHEVMPSSDTTDPTTWSTTASGDPIPVVLPNRLLAPARLSEPVLGASADIAPAARRVSRRPASARASSGTPRVERARRPVAVSDSPEAVVAEAEAVRERWTSFQQGRAAARQVDDEPVDAGRPGDR